MTLVQSLTLLTNSTARWTATQEKAIARDYPFTDIHLETPDQFVLRTYLQFLWLPESIMPLNLLVLSLHRVQDASPPSPDTPHPLHTLLDPVLLSVRSVTVKYHTDIPQILAQDGGEGDPEESMMWYALSYEMGEPGEGIHNEDAILLEEKSRRVWPERLERREVQIQILLYLLKLSLPGPCTPLPRVKIPVNDVVPSAKKKRPKERAKFSVPSPHERLESFMDKLSMWQLVTNMNDSNINTLANKDEQDWMQAFCENVVERQFKSVLPDMCALLRQKLFPHSPFSDEDTDADTRAANSGSHMPGSGHPRPSRKLARSSSISTSISQSKSKPNPKPAQRSSSVISNTAPDTRSRSRSLSVSLAQDASARRANSASGTSSSLKRALSREVSMSRGFKPRAQPSQSSTKVPVEPKKDTKKPDPCPQGVTLVATTPVKPKVRGDARNRRLTASPSRRRSLSDAGMDGFGDDLGDSGDDGWTPVKDEDEELWLPDSSPDVLLLGTRKRAASGSSSSRGLSDPTEEGGMNTPVKKRLRI